MKKLLAITLLSASLAGCGVFSDSAKSVLLGGTSITAGVSNPITPATLYKAEQVATIAVSGLLTYKRLCASGTIPTSCYDTIARIQEYTRKLKPMFVQLRTYVRTNDQINALALYQQVQAIVTQLQAEAAVAAGGN